MKGDLNENTEWESARIEWIGILTLEALLSLLKFNRIGNCIKNNCKECENRRKNDEKF